MPGLSWSSRVRSCCVSISYLLRSSVQLFINNYNTCNETNRMKSNVIMIKLRSFGEFVHLKLAKKNCYIINQQLHYIK